MTGRGECLCRKGYVFWPLNGECYKAFTGGPCRPGQFLTPHEEDENIGRCVVNPCPRAHLYFPGEDFDSQIKCHKVRACVQLGVVHKPWTDFWTFWPPPPFVDHFTK